MLPVAGRLLFFLRQGTVREEGRAEGILSLAVVIKSWYSWARGKLLKFQRKRNQEMCSRLRDTSEKIREKSKGRANQDSILGGPGKGTLQCLHLLL